MKHAVITGGGGGLGQALLGAFSTPGWEVAAPGRQELDVTVPESVQSYFQTRPVDLLVCNAGITRDSLLSRLQEPEWDQVLDVNYHGALRCAEAVLPAMVKQGGGHIVFISSYSAVHPPLGQVAYAAAKAALLGLTRDLTSRYGPYGIRVNAILPGFLETKMTALVSEKRRGEVLASHSLGRFNTVSEVAAFIRFLEESLPHTSGQIFQLDSR